ncbi:MAG: ATP-dependent Clp protease adaptor ClpS [Sulfuricurvum sp.]|nr:ATP-dependent Clp protease adaptor ClpS [Sulfuricurvum sp.]
MAVTIRTHRTNFFPQLGKPKLYLVSIHYDKYISWEFSVRVLIEVFHKSREQAEAITNDILTEGEGICGAYMFEIAESKAKIVEDQAKKEGFSLWFLIEEV